MNDMLTAPLSLLLSPPAGDVDCSAAPFLPPSSSSSYVGRAATGEAVGGEGEGVHGWNWSTDALPQHIQDDEEQMLYVRCARSATEVCSEHLLESLASLLPRWRGDAPQPYSPSTVNLAARTLLMTLVAYGHRGFHGVARSMWEHLEAACPARFNSHERVDLLRLGVLLVEVFAWSDHPQEALRHLAPLVDYAAELEDGVDYTAFCFYGRAWQERLEQRTREQHVLAHVMQWWWWSWWWWQSQTYLACGEDYYSDASFGGFPGSDDIAATLPDVLFPTAASAG